MKYEGFAIRVLELVVIKQLVYEISSSLVDIGTNSHIFVKLVYFPKIRNLQTLVKRFYQANITVNCLPFLFTR